MGELKSKMQLRKWTVSCIRGGMLLQAFSAFSSTLPVPKSDDMAAKVLHFGTDNCNRLLVLQSVGYSVDLCPTVEEFHSMLQKRADADAVLITAGPVSDRRQIVTRIRSYSHAPLVLFNTSYDYADECEFDLVIAPLTHPEVWLRKIAGLIEQTRALNAAATVIREQSTCH